MLIHIFFILRSISKPVLFSIPFSLLLLISCNSEKGSNDSGISNSVTNIKGVSTIRYAIGFNLLNYQEYKVLHIFRHYNELVDTLSYVLHEKGVKIQNKCSEYQRIEIPVQNVALLHTSYLSYFKFCEASHLIKSISEVKYIYDDRIYQAAKEEEITLVGSEESLDKERLLALNPSVVVNVGFPNAPNKGQQVLNELGIPVLILSDWQENTLLGRAEWVKVVAALTGNEEIADQKFKILVEEYNRLKLLVTEPNRHPKIICNLPYKGSWYMPGGNSYMSNVLRDAGGDYLWSDEPGTGGIQIDFEVVYSKGLSADYWINVDAVRSIEEILNKDERLSEFLPIKKRKVFNNNNRISHGAANDYWESGLVNPHIILADLIKILHPDVLPDHTLFYYRQIM